MRSLFAGARIALYRISKNSRRALGSPALPVAGLVVTMLLGSVSAWADDPPADPIPPDPGQVSYRLLSPEETGHQLANDQTLTFYAFWDSAHYEVSANLYMLDNTVSSQEAEWPVGEYIGEQEIFPGNEITKHAYQFTHTISSSNTRPDQNQTIKIKAVNPNTLEETSHSDLRLCLANHPPVNLSAAAVGDSSRFTTHHGGEVYQVRNGDPLIIETEWEYSRDDFMITADFSALDDSFDVNQVHYWGPSGGGQASYTVSYELTETAKPEATNGVAYSVILTGFDGACGYVKKEVLFKMDNHGPTGTPTVFGLPDTTASTTLHLYGSVPTGSHTALVQIDSRTDYSFEAFESGDSLAWSGEIEIPGGYHFINVYGRDVVGNLSPASEHTIVGLTGEAPQFKNCLIQAPGILWVIPEDGTTPVTSQLRITDGTQIRFLSYWDSAEIYEVWADFSNIDTNGPTHQPGNLVGSVERDVAGRIETWNFYEFSYTISDADLNLIEDDRNLLVPVTAYNPATGTETTSEALSFCMNNNPLIHLWTKVVNDPAPFTLHEDIDTTWVVAPEYQFKFMTSWYTPETNLSVRCNFIEADQVFDYSLEHKLVKDSIVDSLSSGPIHTYLHSYLFSAVPLDDATAPFPLGVPIIASDDGCGRDTTVIWLELDETGPSSQPVLTLPPPAKTIDTTVVIAGTVDDETYEVLVSVVYPDETEVYSVILADANGQFSGQTPLLAPGSNNLTIHSRDIMHVKCEQIAEEYTVVRVTGSSIEIPKPFHSGDSFSVNNMTEWSQLDLTIYNLEGDQIRSWSLSGTAATHGADVVWDGLNSHSESVRQGPYLIRIIARDNAGNTAKEEVKAFVFTK